MGRLSEVTLGDLAKGFAKYRPFVLLVAAIGLIVVVVPGRGAPRVAQVATKGNSGAALRSNPLQGDASDTTTVSTDPGATTEQTVAATGTGAAGGTAAAKPGAAAPKAGASQAVAAQAAAGPAGMGEDCDTATGRVKVPSVYAVPCVPPFSGDNGGATYQGVSKDTITIVHYVGQADPTTQAVLAAGGDTDTQDQVNQQFRDYVTLLSRHMETYGRRIKVVDYQGTGKTDDDSAAKADGLKVATEIKAFMSWGAPTSNAYLNELTAHGVECVCTTTLPRDFYLQHAPYVWGNGLPDENQAYLMRAEMIGKQIAGHKAQYAGDPLLQTKDRTFGLIYYETSDHAYAAGEKFFEQELAKYGVNLVDRASYLFDTTTAQQDSQTIMAKFASEGITSVIFVGDPVYPRFYTQAATQQNYKPEWIITGSALTDTTFFARLYDQTQWAHGFGLSLLTARAPKEVGDAYRLLQWEWPGKAPAAPGTFGTIYPTVWLTMVGIHLAGPNLNPTTFRDGMFQYPVSPAKGGVTNGLVSWGRQLWTWDDYNLYDDSTEIWWDPSASGPDENGNSGTGMYRYIDGGKRYLPGQFPQAAFKAFDPNGTVTIYDKLPAQDQYPSYPLQDYHNKDYTCC